MAAGHRLVCEKNMPKRIMTNTQIVRCHRCGAIIYRRSFLDYDISYLKSINHVSVYLLGCLHCPAEMRLKGSKTQYSGHSWRSK